MKDKYWAWVIGTAILLLAIHNRALTLTDSGDTTWVFLPGIGMFTALLCTFVFLVQNYHRITLGSKWLWMPLAVIAISIAASDIWQYAIGNKTVMETLATILFAAFLFELYLAARILGQELFKPFSIAVVIVALSAIPYALMVGGKTGGLASPTNYDMGAGLLIFGVLVSGLRHRWWLLTVALVGLMFMGAEEGYFALVVLGITMLIRRDFSWKMIIPASMVGIGILFLAAVGHLGAVIEPTIEKVDKVAMAMEADGIERSQLLDEATGFRWVTHWHLSPIKPFGYGYNTNAFYEGIPHNVILIIIEQVGIIAAIAWLFVVGYCLIKTKWKYAFIGVLALSVFDHYIWTQVAPWIWALTGVASASMIKGDFIFKEVSYV